MALATFYMQMGVPVADIARQFSKTPNHNAAKTAVQLKSLKGMLPQSCKTMQAEGLCTLDMRDSLCRSIRNPVSYGRIRSGTIVPGPRIESNLESMFVIVCACGKRLGPIKGPEAAQSLAQFHFWSVPIDDEPQHLTMEYEIAKEAKPC